MKLMFWFYQEEEEGNNDNEINDEDYCIIDANQGISMANENGLTTVFIRNIPYSATAKDLGDFVSEKFGDIKDARNLQERYFGKSYCRGMGYVEFQTPESCIKALFAQNIEFKAPDELETQNLVIRLAKPKKQHDTTFIKGIPIGTTEEDIVNTFKSVKPIKVKIARYDNDGSIGCAYVQFKSEEDLKIAVENGNIQIGQSKSKLFKTRRNLDEPVRRRRYRGRRRFMGRRCTPRNRKDSVT